MFHCDSHFCGAKVLKFRQSAKRFTLHFVCMSLAFCLQVYPQKSRYSKYAREIGIIHVDGNRLYSFIAPVVTTVLFFFVEIMLFHLPLNANSLTAPIKASAFGNKYATLSASLNAYAS